jgi:hypothetical protein
MILNKEPIILKYNLSNLNLDSIIKYIKENRVFSLKENQGNYNFLINNNDEFNDLHDKVKSKVIGSFKSITITNKDKKCHVFATDNKFPHGTAWHNHESTSIVNTVLYIKPVKDFGIDFKKDNFFLTVKPKIGDLLIFPNYLDHLPYASYTTDLRISINIEFMTKEKVEEIFSYENIRR